MTIASSVAFEKSVSVGGVSLRDYVNDPEDWAKSFFDSITTDDMLTLLVMSLMYGWPLSLKVLAGVDCGQERKQPGQQALHGAQCY